MKDSPYLDPNQVPNHPKYRPQFVLDRLDHLFRPIRIFKLWDTINGECLAEWIVEDHDDLRGVRDDLFEMGLPELIPEVS